MSGGSWQCRELLEAAANGPSKPTRTGSSGTALNMDDLREHKNEALR
jgi:hypothetical protein